MLDLFSDSQPQQLPMADADVRYWPQIDLVRADHDLINELIETTPWRHQQIVVYRKTHWQPRLTAWHGDVSYRYSGITLPPAPWTPTLLAIKAQVEAVAEATFNSVLLNYYRDQNDSMGMHSDDEPELGACPVIASLSLGEERTLLLKHKTQKALKPIRLPLPSGSLLLMQGTTQTHWQHGIAKLSKPCGPRINLTFRQVSANERMKGSAETHQPPFEELTCENKR